MNNRFTLRRLRAWATIAALSLPGAASAFDWKDGFDLQSRPGDRYGLMYSPYTAHFHPSPDHKYVWLVGVEREREDAQLAGITLFSNSFGQPTTYIFLGGKFTATSLSSEAFS